MDVSDWLRRLGLSQYEKAFLDNDVDAQVLGELTGDDLVAIGVRSVGHRRKLLAAIAALREGGEPASGADLPVASLRSPGGEAERRQLTIMFCDLVGSTAMASRLDPEDMREIIAAYHRVVAETVGRFDGFVAKYMGDGVLIYFGYPRAHEDDAERAVRAGLALVAHIGGLDAAAGKLAARIGVATGLVVVGDLIGSGEAQERGVVGETPNLAARLQALATPNAVLIGEATRRLVGELFEYCDLGAVELRGIAAPVPVFEVLRPSAIESRFEALRAAALSPLVGREEELDLLLRRWRQAKIGGGRAVLLSGEAGIGKSRLAAALQQRLGDEPYTRLRYFCSPHHQDSPFYPLIAQLERAAGLAREDPPAAKLDKLEALLAQAGAVDGETTGLFADLLGLPAEGRYPPLPQDPQHRREMMLSALLAQFEALARQRPVLMIFEDAHWADSTSLELLDRTFDRLVGLPALLVITFRPEFAAPWVGAPHVSALSLSRLAQRETAALAHGITAGKRLPPEILDRIVERTDGIPLFIEELTKSLIEGGLLREEGDGYVLAGPLPPLAIPSSLQDSLMARLDRLMPVKEVAQIGAAIGREFSYDLLAAVARRSETELRAALDQLTEAGLVFRRGTPPRASYIFKHALVQDAAYSTLLRSQRQQLHARIGQVLQERFPQTAEMEPEILAYHFSEAGLPSAAVEYWRRAGERAAQRNAHTEAASHLKRGLALVAGLEAGRDRARMELDLHLALAAAFHALHGQSAVAVRQAYERARDLSEEVGDPQRLFRALMGLWRSTDFSHDGAFDIACRLVERLLELARQTQDPDLMLEAYMAYGTVQLHMGDLPTAQHYLDEAIARYNPERHRSHAMRFSLDPGINASMRASWAQWLRGYPDRALEQSNRTLLLAREINHAHSLGLALSFAAMLHQFRGEPQAAHAIAQEAVAHCAEHRLSQFAATSRFVLGWAIARRGQPADGIRLMQDSLDGYRQIGATMYLSWFLGVLAQALAARGDVAEGLAIILEGVERVHTNHNHPFPPELHRLKGEFLLLERRQPEAEHSFVTALGLMRQRGAKMLELRTSANLARLWRDQGRHGEARDLLAPIYGWFTEGFDTPDLKEAKALLVELGQGAGPVSAA